MTLRFFQHLCYGVSITCALIFSGCATHPPTDAYVRLGPSLTHSNEATKPPSTLALFCDIYVVLDQINPTNNFISIEESKACANVVLEAAKSALQTKGYQVSDAANPTIGASLRTDRVYRTRQKNSDTLEKLRPPLFTVEGFTDLQAHSRLLRALPAAITSYTEQPSTTLRKANSKLDEDLKVLGSRTSERFAMLIVGAGKSISTSKKSGEFVESLLVNAAMGAVGGLTGIWTTSIHDGSTQPFISSWVALLNCDTGEIVWANSLRLYTDPSGSSLKKLWPEKLLYHLPTAR